MPGATVDGVSVYDHFDPYAPWDDCADKDPDSHSPRLQCYHRRLWSGRPLAGLAGEGAFALEQRRHGLLDTALGTFFDRDEGLYLTSDRAMATWWGWRETAGFREDSALMERVLAANPVLGNMGGIIMWPGRRVGGPTLNQARGLNHKATIAGRLDLTVECIRRAYSKAFYPAVNPLGPTLKRYWPFFELFGDFESYVEFWLLDDLLAEGGLGVRSFMGGDLMDHDFATRRPLPSSVEEYDEYLRNAQAFVLKRNRRMAELWLTLEWQ